MFIVIVDMLWCNAMSLPRIVHTIPLCDKLYKRLQSIKVDVDVDISAWHHFD